MQRLVWLLQRCNFTAGTQPDIASKQTAQTKTRPNVYLVHKYKAIFVHSQALPRLRLKASEDVWKYLSLE